MESLLSYVPLMFFVVWFFSSWYLRKNKKSKTISVGGGFLGACIFFVVVSFALIPSNTNTNGRHQDKIKPAAQEAFERAISQHMRQYEATKNELVQRQLREQRKNKIAEILPDKSATHWLGVVKEIGATSDGKGILAINIDGGIQIKTYNNFFSDAGPKTLIPPDSDLYKVLLTLNPGSRVVFSGSFFESRQDYINEISISEAGSMRMPEFLMRFSFVERY
ncbi:hypothetical protein [Desulfobotulus sp.]|uniref:hypothetical protein n=1 Tax=Desulfobotulus sp. TaxID=1940337 RepID=UPI002A35BE63|nr:hypothetical protein [Desulfobotulus sp.]MDY0164516.1 hypothetical protein [Desulfobotulus sp.]